MRQEQLHTKLLSWTIVSRTISLTAVCQLPCIDLHGSPIQYREVQGFESQRFMSYFPKFITLKGGVSTGFHHVSEAPPLDLHRLYRITFTRTTSGSSLVIRQVPADASSLVEGDVYVLDKGTKLLQFNAKTSAGQERFKAAEFVQALIQDRKSQCSLTVYGKSPNNSCSN